ncbi:hypothetical protein E2C01_080611 [Portunus trituberculatus]|uniref:Uncharacterized protein n=1 Tax=Portunus trituberculatus TaxID=210409 RepID=A0A5B7J023_PORTR|nr:hypothetical protein [Portunus trituberculatus]
MYFNECQRPQSPVKRLVTTDTLHNTRTPWKPLHPYHQGLVHPHHPPCWSAHTAPRRAHLGTW